MDDKKTEIYERITRQIVEAIEAGAEKFRMPWHVTGAECWAPANAASGRAYRGVNAGARHLIPPGNHAVLALDTAHRVRPGAASSACCRSQGLA